MPECKGVSTDAKKRIVLMRNDAGSPGFGKNGCQEDVYGRANTIGIPWKNVPQCAAVLSLSSKMQDVENDFL